MTATGAARIRVLLVAQPGRLTNGLRTLLADTQVEVVGVVAGSQELAKILAQMQPVMVVIDVQLQQGSFIDAIRLTHRQIPPLCCLVLVESYQQQVQAVQAGADATLLKGFTETELLTTIFRLQSPPEVHP